MKKIYYFMITTIIVILACGFSACSPKRIAYSDFVSEKNFNELPISIHAQYLEYPNGREIDYTATDVNEITAIMNMIKQLVWEEDDAATLLLGAVDPLTFTVKYEDGESVVFDFLYVWHNGDRFLSMDSENRSALWEYVKEISDYRDRYRQE